MNKVDKEIFRFSGWCFIIGAFVIGIILFIVNFIILAT